MGSNHRLLIQSQTSVPLDQPSIFWYKGEYLYVSSVMVYVGIASIYLETKPIMSEYSEIPTPRTYKPRLTNKRYLYTFV